MLRFKLIFIMSLITIIFCCTLKKVRKTNVIVVKKTEYVYDTILMHNIVIRDYLENVVDFKH